MLKRFLELFSQILKLTEQNSIVESDDEYVAETVKLYPLLSEDDKNKLFDIIKDFGTAEDPTRLYFEFLCLRFYKDARYADDILDCVLFGEMDLTRRFFYFSVLDRELFLTGVMADYSKRVSLEKKIVDGISKGHEETLRYRPYGKRDQKKVVIVIRPFLGEYHSPSLQTINLDNYLRKLGYDTYYVSFCENDILSEYALDVCAPFKRNELFSGIKGFEYSCFDMVLKGIHFDIRTETMSEDIISVVEHISQINPEFIIGIEGCNIVADMCTKVTDVITMNVVDDLPVTLSDYVLRYFPGEIQKGYINASQYGKQIFEARYDNELMPYNDADEEKIVLSPERFHICLMGNRLDEEINDEMLKVLKRLLTEVPKADLLFIGDCPKTESKLHDYSSRCRFAGYVKRCEDTVGECNMFLNPPRKGGGGGGYMAIKRSVPVYTLKDCDVASCVGDEFTFESYDELIPFVIRCIDNKEYYESVRTLSGENYKKRYGINSLENVTAFCETFTKQISSRN